MNPTSKPKRPGVLSRRLALFTSLAFGCIAALPASAIFINQNPVNPNASQATKNVLAMLASLPNQASPTNKIISGQMVCDATSYTTGFTNLVDALHTQTGQWPGLLGFDYCDEPQGPMGDTAARNAITQQAKDQWNRGGLFMVIPHFGNPWRKGIIEDIVDANGNPKKLYPNYRNVKGALNANGTSALDQLYAAGFAGTAPYINFHQDLDALATEFGKFQTANMVVLFNPIAENNGHDFWWSYQGPYGSATNVPVAEITEYTTKFNKLWEHIYNYLTVTKGLNNLLFVWSPAGANVAPGRDMTIKANSDRFYPQVPIAGTNPVQYKKYVDIVGFDYYITDQADTIYTRLGSVYSNLQTYNRPVGICQTGRSAPIVDPTENWSNELNIQKLTLLGLNTSAGVVFFQNWKGSWSIKATAASVASTQWAMMTNAATYNAGDGGLHVP